MSRKSETKRVGAAWWVIDRRRSRAHGWVAALVGVSVMLGAQACRDDEPDPELSDQPATIATEELGRIGGRIYNEPDRAGEILAEAGLTPDEFEKRVREVTNDPALAREYTRGFEVVARPRTDDRVDSLGVQTTPDSTTMPGVPPNPYRP